MSEAGSTPETLSVGVVRKEKDVALVDTSVPEPRDALPYELPAKTSASVLLDDDEMVQIPAAAVVAAKDGGDKLAFMAHSAAQSGVTFEETHDGGSVVRFAEADAGRLSPEMPQLVIVGGGYRTSRPVEGYG